MKRLLLLSLCLTAAAVISCKDGGGNGEEQNGKVTKAADTQYSVTANGCVEGNCENGTGTMIQPNGNRYTGQFKNGKPNGTGTAFWSISGDTYTGQWKNDMMNGKGTYTFGPRSQWNGDTYRGQWKNDKMHGKGTYTFGPRSRFAGDTYTGGYKNGTKHGSGTYLWSDGNKYVGGWMADCMHGRGVFYRNDGSVLRGTWRMDEYVGK